MTVHLSRDEASGQCSVLFTLESDAVAGVVSVVGPFNGWTAGVDTLVLQEDGTLSVTVLVASDQDVHFRYLAEGGVWFDDPDADEITPAGSVVHLSLPTATPGPGPGLVQGEGSGAVHARAELLPEEQVVGSDDRQAQAEAIIADSETRVREQAADVRGASLQTEPRTSDQATDPL